ncbi:hypothetical protein TFLX_00793 [Thermoflexales bacterium]|nr:hypothetical protein TFLX_00793 [Thermoflexales bacterium]
MNQLFTRDDAWSGGFYELVLELPESSAIGAKNALAQLWSYSSLTGCFLRRDIEPANQPQVSPLDIENEGHWYGIATLPNGKTSVCGSFWGDYQASGCWLTWYLPLGSLGTAYPVRAYPFNLKTEPSPEPWINEISTWLKDIAISIYPQLRFKLAIIGYEVDFFEVKAKLNEGIPSQRWESLLIPSEDKFVWYPQTIYEPPYTMEKRLR